MRDKIKNIIFDLGGVIIDIHPAKTYEAFNGHIDEMPAMSVYLTDLFHQLETGKIDADTFIEEAKREWKINLPNEQICEGLNAMLGDIPPERIHAVEKVKEKYNTYLLSNTNAIHFNSVQRILQDHVDRDSFEELFHRTYYSHKIGLRKPDVKIYELVLKENNLIPEETLFLDDLGENLKSAKSIGIHTIQVTTEKDIVEILKDF